MSEPLSDYDDAARILRAWREQASTSTTADSALSDRQRFSRRYALEKALAAIAEVERLRAQVAAMRPIVERVASDCSLGANSGPYFDASDFSDIGHVMVCAYCGNTHAMTWIPGPYISPEQLDAAARQVIHAPDCPVTLARQITQNAPPPTIAGE